MNSIPRMQDPRLVEGPRNSTNETPLPVPVPVLRINYTGPLFGRILESTDEQPLWKASNFQPEKPSLKFSDQKPVETKEERDSQKTLTASDEPTPKTSTSEDEQETARDTSDIVLKKANKKASNLFRQKSGEGSKVTEDPDLGLRSSQMPPPPVQEAPIKASPSNDTSISGPPNSTIAEVINMAHQNTFLSSVKAFLSSILRDMCCLIWFLALAPFCWVLKSIFFCSSPNSRSRRFYRQKLLVIHIRQSRVRIQHGLRKYCYM
jgi:hypothetical protein